MLLAEFGPSPRGPPQGQYACMPTPSHTKGPFHLPPENVHDASPARDVACVEEPGHGPPSGSRLPLQLTGSVRAASYCLPIAVAAFDIWTSVAIGSYRDDSGLRRERRHLVAT